MSTRGFRQRLDKLRSSCLRCFCEKMAEFQPRIQNQKIADHVMKTNGEPPCVCDGKAKLEFERK